MKVYDLVSGKFLWMERAGRGVFPAGWFLLLFIFSTVAYAQDDPLDRVINLPAQRATLFQFLNQVADSTGYSFVYDSQVIPSDHRIKPVARKGTVKEILGEVIPVSGLKIKVIGNHILLFNENPGLSITGSVMPEDSSDFFVSRGRVVDYHTGEPVPFATIGLEGIALGNVANAEGLFMLRVPSIFAGENLAISHVGYKRQVYPAKLLATGESTIFLERSYLSIQEVIIRNAEPFGIVKEAVRRIPLNYLEKPAILTSFYREGVLVNKKMIHYFEGVFEIFLPSYKEPTGSGQVKLLQSRSIRNLDSSDTLVVKLKGGVGVMLDLDIARVLPDFLDPSTMKHYLFFRDDVVTFGSRVCYAIRFEQKENIHEPLFKGMVYIDVDNLAILAADFEINPDLVGQTANQFVVKGSRRITVRPEKVSYRVTYHEQNGKFYLGHARANLDFRYRERRKLFFRGFSTFIEMVASEANLEDTRRFDRRETMSKSAILSEQDFEYNPLFWSDFNFIAPEEDINSALQIMRARIQVESHDD